ncbi:hypothetical protein DSAG12_01394 [Promethearchaeum syntrophicum]|uniref:Uncharacterized protein n=1 Tax=Promethearchaeum syntrophicum TaxID=2594042 RepID=A0A5B9D8H9_9ARCH|nr:hypothetical protein [Candidatus Prometheoarchaeum syntrophicum]
MISNRSAKISISTSLETISRNSDLVKEHLLRQMRESLAVGKRLIGEELTGLTLVLKPIVLSMYSNLVQKDLEKGTIKTINQLLNLSKSMIVDGIELKSEQFYKRLTDNFPIYLKNDQTGRLCKRNHMNFKRLEDNLRKTFEAQICSIIPLLKIDNKEIQNYYQLCRSAFETVEECKSILKKQTDAMYNAQQIIKKDLSILDIPTARSIIFKILRKGFDIQVRNFDKAIERIYAADMV